MAARLNFSSRTIVLSGVSALSATVTGLAYWRVHAQRRREAEERARVQLLLQARANALSQDLVIKVLGADQSLRLVSELLVKAARHPDFLRALSDFLRHVFIEDPRGKEALRKFLVDDVIRDPWVLEHLLKLVDRLGADIAADSAVWPAGTVDALRVAAMDALETDTFNEELWDAVSRSLWGALVPW
jgi:hypothetical protein